MSEIDPTFEFEILNIKLQTKKNDIERFEAYKTIIKRLVEQKLHSAIGANIHMIIYSAYPKVTNTGVEYIYGRIGKGIYFSSTEGNAIDIESLETENEFYDTSKIYNPDITDYVFIPAAHRLCVKVGNKITGNQVRRFLLSNVHYLIDKGDKIEIELQNEETTIEELLNAKKVHKLDYFISYTNDDTLKSAASLFDRRLKSSQIGKIRVKAEADHHDQMIVEGQELLEGGIELARHNGTINSAEITTTNGERKQLSTKERPKRIKVQSDYESFRNVLVSTIMLLFRGNI